MLPIPIDPELGSATEVQYVVNSWEYADCVVLVTPFESVPVTHTRVAVVEVDVEVVFVVSVSAANTTDKTNARIVMNDTDFIMQKKEKKKSMFKNNHYNCFQ